MILADVFKCSKIARECDFQTSGKDRPLVVQFAAKNSCDFGAAARLIAPYADAVDLNCGCPQRWAIKEGIGSALMSAPPALVQDMVSQGRHQSNLPISVKMRLHEDPQQSVLYARQIEAAGAAWITIHGRTVQQKSTQPVDYEAIRLIKESVSIPVVANGNIFTLNDAIEVQKTTKVNGVMAARGLLKNPALFSEAPITPISFIEDFVATSLAYGTCSFIFHQHLGFMLEDGWLRNASIRKQFNTCTSIASILDFLNQNVFRSQSNPS